MKNKAGEEQNSDIEEIPDEPVSDNMGSQTSGYVQNSKQSTEDENDESSQSDDLPDIDSFNDSSDDETLVEKNPYKGLNRLSKKNLSSWKRDHTVYITSIGKNFNEIKRQDMISHQKLLRTNAKNEDKKEGKKKRSPSKFPKPLKEVAHVSDTVLSDSSITCEDKVAVPTFRGITTPGSAKGLKLFLHSQVAQTDALDHSTQSFNLAKIELDEYLASFLAREEDLDKYKIKYRFPVINSTDYDTLNEQLVDKARLLKKLFSAADKIVLSFENWITIFENKIRNATKLASKQLSLAYVLSGHYVNNYVKFQDDFSKLTQIVDAALKIDGSLIDAVEAIKAIITEINACPKLGDLSKYMPFLSEGQIPRHGLLYGFKVKMYGKLPDPSPLYNSNLKPKNAYVGKLFIIINPHDIFNDKKDPIVVHKADEEGAIGVSKTIVGEKEIQHQGSNLKGKIRKTIKLKLPKFNHERMPEWYRGKYGLDEAHYTRIRRTFLFLNRCGEYEKLSWMYLETIVLAHLIHFHEIQCVNYCFLLAKESDSVITPYSRKGAKLSVDSFERSFSDIDSSFQDGSKRADVEMDFDSFLLEEKSFIKTESEKDLDFISEGNNNNSVVMLDEDNQSIRSTLFKLSRASIYHSHNQSALEDDLDASIFSDTQVPPPQASPITRLSSRITTQDSTSAKKHSSLAKSVGEKTGSPLHCSQKGKNTPSTNQSDLDELLRKYSTTDANNTDDDQSLDEEEKGSNLEI